MPRLPDVVRDINRNIPNDGARVVPLRAESGYTNLDPLAEAIGHSANMLREQQDEFDTARARSSLLQSHVNAINSLTDDNYDTYHERYSKQMQDGLKNAAELVKTPSVRARFELDAQDMIIRGSEAANHAALDKEGDISRAQLENMITTNRQAYLRTNDPAVKAELISAVQSGIAGGVTRNYLTHTQGEQLARATSIDFVKASIEDMGPAAQIDALTRKPYAIGQVKLTPQDDPRMQPLVDHSNANVRNKTTVHNSDGSESSVKTASFTTEDGKTVIVPTVWDGKILSPREGYKRAMASGIKWPTFDTQAEADAADAKMHELWRGTPSSPADLLPEDVRTQMLHNAKADLEAQRNAAERAQKDAIEKAYNSTMSAIMGKQVNPGEDSLNAMLRKDPMWEHYSPSQQNDIRSAYRNSAKDGAAQDDPDTVIELRDKLHHRTLTLSEINKQKAHITDATRISIADDLSKMDTETETKDAAARTYSNDQLIQLAADSVKDIKKDPALENQFKREAMTQIDAEARRQGVRTLGASDTTKVLDNLMIQVVKKKGIFFDSTAPAYQALQEIPTSDREKIDRYFARRNMVPTAQQILDLHNAEDFAEAVK